MHMATWKRSRTTCSSQSYKVQALQAQWLLTALLQVLLLPELQPTGTVAAATARCIVVNDLVNTGQSGVVLFNSTESTSCYAFEIDSLVVIKGSVRWLPTSYTQFTALDTQWTVQGTILAAGARVRVQGLHLLNVALPNKDMMAAGLTPPAPLMFQLYPLSLANSSSTNSSDIRGPVIPGDTGASEGGTSLILRDVVLHTTCSNLAPYLEWMQSQENGTESLQYVTHAQGETASVIKVIELHQSTFLHMFNVTVTCEDEPTPGTALSSAADGVQLATTLAIMALLPQPSLIKIQASAIQLPPGWPLDIVLRQNMTLQGYGIAPSDHPVLDFNELASVLSLQAGAVLTYEKLVLINMCTGLFAPDAARMPGGVFATSSNFWLMQYNRNFRTINMHDVVLVVDQADVAVTQTGVYSAPLAGIWSRYLVGFSVAASRLAYQLEPMVLSPTGYTYQSSDGFARTLRNTITTSVAPSPAVAAMLQTPAFCKPTNVSVMRPPQLPVSSAGELYNALLSVTAYSSDPLMQSYTSISYPFTLALFEDITAFGAVVQTAAKLSNRRIQIGLQLLISGPVTPLATTDGLWSLAASGGFVREVPNVSVDLSLCIGCLPLANSGVHVYIHRVHLKGLAPFEGSPLSVYGQQAGAGLAMALWAFDFDRRFNLVHLHNCTLELPRAEFAQVRQLAQWLLSTPDPVASGLALQLPQDMQGLKGLQLMQVNWTDAGHVAVWQWAGFGVNGTQLIFVPSSSPVAHPTPTLLPASQPNSAPADQQDPMPYASPAPLPAPGNGSGQPVEPGSGSGDSQVASGAVAGIVVGSVAGAAGLAAVSWWAMRGRKQQRRPKGRWSRDGGEPEPGLGTRSGSKSGAMVELVLEGDEEMGYAALPNPLQPRANSAQKGSAHGSNGTGRWGGMGSQIQLGVDGAPAAMNSEDASDSASARQPRNRRSSSGNNSASANQEVLRQAAADEEELQSLSKMATQGSAMQRSRHNTHGPPSPDQASATAAGSPPSLGCQDPLSTPGPKAARKDPADEVKQMITDLGAGKDKGKLAIFECIGQGGYGTVYRGMWCNMEVAVKTMVFSYQPPLHDSSNQQQEARRNRQRFLREAAVCSSVCHTNVVATFHYDIVPVQSMTGQMVGIKGMQIAEGASVDYKMYLVQEHCHMSLQALLQSPLMQAEHAGVVRPELALAVLLDVAYGMVYLHSRNIVHGDLTPGNILLKFDKEGGFVAKITDFGLCELLDPGKTHVSNHRVGTPWYVAPEVATSSKLTLASDVYGFGVVMGEVFSGQQPYMALPSGGYTRNPRFGRVSKSGQLRDGPVAALVLLYRQLFNKCVALDPKERPTFEDILQALRHMAERLSKPELGGAAQPALATPPAAVLHEQERPAAARPRASSAVPPSDNARAVCASIVLPAPAAAAAVSTASSNAQLQSASMMVHPEPLPPLVVVKAGSTSSSPRSSSAAAAGFPGGPGSPKSASSPRRSSAGHPRRPSRRSSGLSLGVAPQGRASLHAPSPAASSGQGGGEQQDDELSLPPSVATASAPPCSSNPRMRRQLAGANSRTESGSLGGDLQPQAADRVAVAATPAPRTLDLAMPVRLQLQHMQVARQ